MNQVPDMIVVDTDILIDAGRGVDEALDYLQQIGQTSDIAISVVTQMELIIGCRNGNELRSLDSFLRRLLIIKIDEAISDKAIELLKHYRLSHGLLIADAIIAATAIATGQQFASKNKRDYCFIENLKLLPYPKPG